MGHSYSYDNEHAQVEFTEQDGQFTLRVAFKKPPAPPIPAERPAAPGRRVIVPAHEHMRRKGTYADDMVILAADANTFEVSSRSEPGAFHIVLIDGEQEVCDCTAASYGRLCRHVKGVRTLLGRDIDAPLRSRNGVVPQAPDYGLPITLTDEPSD